MPRHQSQRDGRGQVGTAGRLRATWRQVCWPQTQGGHPAQRSLSAEQRAAAEAAVTAHGAPDLDA